MSWPRVAAARLRALFTRPRLERELDDEVRFHLEMEVDANLARGMSARDARHAALRNFGGVDPMKELYRDRRALPFVETTAQDIRYALRTLRRSPAFTAAAVAVLAIAIGANTAMFSVLNAVILRPLPFPEPDRLAIVRTVQGRSTLRLAEVLRDHGQSVAGLAVFDGASITLTSPGEAAQIRAVRASPAFFDLLGIQPALGRSFTPLETVERRRLALIGYNLWQQRFGGSPGAIGASIEIDGRTSVIVGILPAAVPFPAAVDVWEPHTLSPNWETASYWSVLARLRPRVTAEQAEAELTAVARNFDSLSRGILVVPLTLHITDARPRLALWMLSGAVFAVLLIAASNVAGLVLARSASRRREFSTRFALGASRSRVVRQLLAESLTLAVVAGGFGLLIAGVIVRLVLAFRPGDLARLDEVALDPRALAASFALCLLTAALVGLAPAASLGQRVTGPAGRGLRRALVAGEFALAIVLLTAAGLFLRSLWNLEGVDPGFRPERILSVSAAAPRTGFYDPALARIAALPGVESAAIVSNMFTSSTSAPMVAAEGSPGIRMTFRGDEISDGFFQTVGTPLLRGRFFQPGDGARPPKVAIVNETLARRLWPAHDPVGRRFRIAGGDWIAVVGVARDMRRQGPESEPIAQMFEPLAQNPGRLIEILVRASNDNPLALAPSVQAAVYEVNKSVHLYGVNTLERRLAGYLSPRRLQTTLVAAFSVMALLIAAIGIYGLVQYSVTARTREIGIRIAIGARAGTIFGLVLREGLSLGLIGTVLGVIAALALNRFAATLLFGVSATDPLTLLAVSGILLAVTAVACFFPARRAMKLDPVTALRLE